MPLRWPRNTSRPSAKHEIVRMNRHYSLYLDFTRFLAAAVVLLTHANRSALAPLDWVPSDLGHNAVVVFFVLSGCVISFVADNKETSFRRYWVSRLARVYSVALPALLVTPLFDLAGEALVPAVYEGGLTTHDWWGVRIAASLACANELWFVSIMPFSNSPYWSLCYEISYYALFSIWCFTQGTSRYLWLAGLGLLIGPKILLLLPIWI